LNIEVRETIRDVARFYFGNEALGWDKSLEALGKRLDAIQVSYYEYFAYLINKYADTARYRNTRTSERIFDRFADYKKDLIRHAELNAYLDIENFEAHINLKEEPKDILLDETVELTPLFKYVMALTLGLYGIAPQFQDKAVLQLKENTEYFRTFAKFRHVFPVKQEEIISDKT